MDTSLRVEYFTNLIVQSEQGTYEMKTNSNTIRTSVSPGNTRI